MDQFQNGIYDPTFITSLFDSMSKTYAVANYVTSFGFSERWRKQCVRDLPNLPKGAIGYDLMSGMGESWKYILPRMDEGSKLTAVDISTEMNKRAQTYINRTSLEQVSLSPMNVLENNIPTESADFVVSCFGIKTFNHKQSDILAAEVYRILKKGGVFAFVEISEPNGWVLKRLYMFYLKIIIPFIGKVFLGNATDYRMLGRYCEGFRDCKAFSNLLQQNGLQTNYKSYFYGCATAVFGKKG